MTDALKPAGADKIATMDAAEVLPDLEAIARDGSFVDAYQAFNRALNRMQSKYLEFKEESERQSRLLQEANAELRKLSLRNRAVTEFLNSILSSVTSGIIVVNGSGQISHINPAAERIFGASSSEALGVRLDEVVRDASGGALSGSEREPLGLADRDGSQKAQRRLVVADGSAGIFLCASAPLSDAEGQIFGSVEVFQDITNEKEMERQIRRMESLAALGEMAASVAHQVRNPLVSVKGFASLLAAESGSAKSEKSHANQILKGVDNLERVIDALLRFSRREELTLKPTNLNRYLSKVVRQFNERIAIADVDHSRDADAYGQRCEVRFTPSEKKISADVDHLIFREVVQNILQNAQESAARPVNSTVRVEFGQEIERTVVISISDDGPGMNAETVDSIFRPFFTTKSSGSGLGLALAKKIVSAHGGALEVVSSPGKGTTFSIVLPQSTQSGRSNAAG